MPARLVVGLLLALVFAMAPASAHADAPAAWQRKALETAQRVWHPACGRLTLSFEQPPLGLASDYLWNGWAWSGDCDIRVSRSIRWLGYPDFCSTILHEGGHAAGRGHSTNPNSIMYADRTISLSRGRANGRHATHWTGADRRCIRPMDRR